MVSVVVPTYASSSFITESLTKLHDVCSNIFDEFEIIVVLDGNDETVLRKVHEASVNHEYVVHTIEHSGQHWATYEGCKIANGNPIFTVDDDGEFDYSDMRKLYNCWTTDTIVYGVRSVDGKRAIRRVLFYCYLLVCKLVPSLRFSSFRCFDRKCLTSLKYDRNAYPRHFLFDLILSSSCARMFVPVRYRAKVISRYSLTEIIGLTLVRFLTLLRTRFAQKHPKK